MIRNSSGIAAACVLCERKRMHLSYIYIFFTLKWQTGRSSVFKQERFVSKCEAFSGSEQPRGRNETAHSSSPSFTILSLPPSFTCLLLLSLSPSTGKSVTAAARPRSVWLDRFYSKLPVLPFKLLPPQLCNTSETVWWKGDSLGSRVRPGADRLQPVLSEPHVIQYSRFFLPTSLIRPDNKPPPAFKKVRKKRTLLLTNIFD